MRFRTPTLLIPLLSSCSMNREVDSSIDAHIGARVDSIFNAEVRPDGPGCAVGVYRDGKLALTRAYGVASVEERRPITSRTTFNLGSVAKQFTALAVLQLEQQGRLSLTDDLRRFLPEMPVYSEPIRIRDLLAHTSGLRDYGELELLVARPIDDMARFLELVARQRTLNFRPGTRHEYSHSDYELLGLIVERASGEPFGRYLETKVLQPLGMMASHVYDARRPVMPERAYGHRTFGDGFQLQFPKSAVVGGDNLYTSVDELYRWDLALAEGASGKNLLIARMLVLPTLKNGDIIPYAWGIRRGNYRGLPILTRGGRSRSTRTEIIRFPRQNFGVAVLCNGSQFLPGSLGERVADCISTRSCSRGSRCTLHRRQRSILNPVSWNGSPAGTAVSSRSTGSRLSMASSPSCLATRCKRGPIVATATSPATARPKTFASRFQHPPRGDRFDSSRPGEAKRATQGFGCRTR